MSNLPMVGLISCGKAKLAHPAAAKDLYTGALFRLSRAWIESRCPEWAIISALHGLVLPGQIIAPYDKKADPKDDTWAASTRAAIAAKWPGRYFLSLLPAAYERTVEGFRVESPCRGMAMFARMTFLSQKKVP